MEARNFLLLSLIFVISISSICINNISLIYGFQLSVSSSLSSSLSSSNHHYTKITKRIIGENLLKKYNNNNNNNRMINSNKNNRIIKNNNNNILYGKGSSHLEGIQFDDILDGSDCTIGIIRTRWNDHIVSKLHDGVYKALLDCGVNKDRILESIVPGAFELPYAAKMLAMSRQCDAVITLGCLVKGETSHYEYISEALVQGLMNVQLQTTIPCIFGILTTYDEEQAMKRATGDNNHGISWGKTAVEMALLRTEALGPRVEGKRGTLPLGGANQSSSSNENRDLTQEQKDIKQPKRKIFF